MDWRLVVGTTATILTVLFAWPQAVRALRTDNVSGISPLTSLLVFFTGVSWATFGVLIGDPAIVIADSLAAVASATTLAAIAARGLLQVRVVVPAVAAFAFGMFVAVGMLGYNGAGIVGTILATTMVLPQLVRLFRGEVEGVSPAMYALLATMSSCWLVYGILISEPVAVAPNLITVPTALVVIGRLAIAPPSAAGTDGAGAQQSSTARTVRGRN